MRLLPLIALPLLPTPAAASFFSVAVDPSRRILSSGAAVMTSTTSSLDAALSNKEAQKKKKPLSIAILGGGISGLSCASQLLSRHKQQHSSFDLEVTLFDTGRLRPGGRCSSRLVGDKPPVVKNRTSGVTPIPRPQQRRACDNDAGLLLDSNNDSTQNQDGVVTPTPENIQKALRANDNLADQQSNNNRARVLNSMGPIDHAAQIISVPKLSNEKSCSAGDGGMGQFQKQIEEWMEGGVLESFPEGSVCELLNDCRTNQLRMEALQGEMYYGKGGMGNIPLVMRDYCLTFNGFGESYTGQSFRIAQDLWVSPSNGVKYIGKKNDDDSNDDEGETQQWELRAGSKSLGKYNKLIIAHNGKCADRIMSKTPAKEFHSLLRTKFAPNVPQWGGREMTLNSIYSLVFALKSNKDEGGGGGGGGGGGTSSISKAISNLCTSSRLNNDVYTIMIKNEPNLRLLSCNTLKHHHTQNSNSNSNIEIYTLLSSPQFGKQFKGPQENLPLDLQEKVVMKMLTSLERSLKVQQGGVADEVVDLKLQLWGAAVPMNTWSSSSLNFNDRGGVDGFVYDAKYGVGAVGDWILDPSVAGAWLSGRRLADWLLNHHEGGEKNNNEWSVGLPDLTNNGNKNGKFIPSRVALESGIGTIPSSPNPSFEFSTSNDHQNQGRQRGRGRGGRGGGGRGRGIKGSNNMN